MPFDERRADYACAFIESLKHTKGRWAGVPFKLLPWQREIIRDVYGTVDDTGKRQYQYIYLEIPKKNGKSELAAAIALYHLYADGEQRGEIFSCAADRSQAALVFDVAADMMGQSPVLAKRTKLTKSLKILEDKPTGSIYKVVSAEAFTKHGLNVSCVIFDELHAQPNRDLWDVMTTGSGDARSEPLWFVITTAGDDVNRTSIGWEVHEKARKIINGEIDDPRWYCKIWGIEPDYQGDIWDEKLWWSVNPSLGETIDIEKVRAAAESAKSNQTEEANFRWLRLNQWVALKKVGWLPITLWDQTDAKWTREDLRGKSCYVGIDLSTTTDLTATCSLFPPDDDCEKWRFFIDVWMPEDNMAERERVDHVPFRQWISGEHIHTTPGDVVDYGAIAEHIKRSAREYDIKYFCGDPWHLEILRQLLPQDLQERVIHIPQTMQGMSNAMKELERCFKEGRIEHEITPVGRWCFGNVVVISDGNENIKPDKKRSRDRIDPTCALIDAMAAAIKLEQQRSVYEDRGLRVL